MRLIKTTLIALLLVLALLCFPSVTTWMAAGWLLWHRKRFAGSENASRGSG